MRKNSQEDTEMMEIRGEGDALICRLGWCNGRPKIYSKNGRIDWVALCEKVKRAMQAHRGRLGKKKKTA